MIPGMVPGECQSRRGPRRTATTGRPRRTATTGVRGERLRAEVEHDLAGRAAAVDQLERIGRVLEREPGADDRADEALADQAVDRAADLPVELWLAQHVGAPAGADHLGV